jgi:formamidopyrimidine-DNA glycosylase
MPELPEVETVRSGLAPSVTGATVDSIQILDERSLKRHIGGPSDFVSNLTGRKILGVVRRGKFLWMPLEARDGDLGFGSAEGAKPLALVGHLGMSGQMLLRHPGHPEDKLTRVIVHLTEKDGLKTEFRFVDQRIFGSLAIDVMIPTKDGKPGGFSAGVGDGTWWLNLIPASAAHIARDPLDPDFDSKATLGKLRTKNTGIKRALLDQGLLSGIGNIYADETLWQTKLHYDQPANTISSVKANEILAAVRAILARAVEVGGTSFDEQYKNVNGESGYFEISLHAYGRTGTPCNRCGTDIVREEWANRGSHFCPRCQPLKRK